MCAEGCYSARVTGSPLALDATLRAHLETLGPQLSTLELSPRSTIVPPEVNDTGGRRALELLVPIRTLQDELVLSDTLGEGGMGIVKSGVQRSLGRAVAVKTLRAGENQPQNVLALLREAWVTGSLEHPNILPIHDVRLDEEGAPLVILKRIEGIDWSEVMHDPERVRERFGATDRLEHNLSIFMQVCHAIAFAHSRGIVHRDIKPENVRIGAFGETYVLDWGIALALEDDGTGRFPVVKANMAMAGTPTYMAPEMLGGADAPPISIRTDIYLLGATLYEIATGRPPHDKPDAASLLRSVLVSEPKLDGVPPELADIIRRAMAPDPLDRYPGAEDVRAAVAHFLAHRGSEKLVEEALSRAVKLEALLANAGDEQRVIAYDLLGASRAGFQSALETWPDNDAARRGLAHAIELMVDYELRRGDARAALELMRQLEEPPPPLANRVTLGLRAQAASEARQSELEQLGQDLDPTVGKRTRVFLTVLFGVFWTAIPVFHAHGVVDADASSTHLGIATFALVMAIALFAWARESLTRTAYNRRLVSVVLLTLLGHLVLTAGSALMGLAPDHLTVLYLLVWTTSASVTTVTLESKLWPCALTYLAAFLVSARWPEVRFYCMSLSNAALAINATLIWRAQASSASPALDGALAARSDSRRDEQP